MANFNPTLSITSLPNQIELNLDCDSPYAVEGLRLVRGTGKASHTLNVHMQVRYDGLGRFVRPFQLELPADPELKHIALQVSAFRLAQEEVLFDGVLDLPQAAAAVTPPKKMARTRSIGNKGKVKHDEINEFL